MGWKLTGNYPNHLSHVVYAIAPHTSNWDFILAICIRNAYGLKINYVGKASLFRFPLGIFMRALGGIPVIRTSKNNFVQDTANALLQEPRAHLILSPEGTRSKVEKFRTGFYYIACAMDAPIQLTRYDWEKREIHFGTLFYPTENAEADLAYIWDYFKGIQGYRPEFGIL